jgi:pilus assembly protein CpaB
MKRITPGTVTVAVLAILFGLVSAYMARHYFQVTPAATAKAIKPQMATVVVAKFNLPKYARLRDADLELMRVAPTSVPQGSLQVSTRAVGRLVKNTVMAGQPVFDKDLFAVGEVPLLSDQLPPGFQAVTLAVDANSALNGMIQPESMVDIAMTVDNDRPEVGGLATLTLVRGVKVLATSEQRFKAAEDKPAELRNITVAVTPEQANKLILAQRYGTLSVSLRSTVDADLVAAKSDNERNLVNTLDLLGLPAPQPAIEPIPEVAPTKTAQIWRGGQMVEVTFDANAIVESHNATAVSEGHEPTETVPVSAEKSATGAKKGGCKTCGKKGQPTAAPVKPTASHRASGTGQGQVVQVQVEAHQARH